MALRRRAGISTGNRGAIAPGRALAAQGQGEEGMAQIHQGLAA